MAVLLYATHIWGGGDSKLLIFLCFLTPANTYYYHGDELFAILNLIVFIFSVGYIFIALQTLFFILAEEQGIKRKISICSILTFLKDFVLGMVYIFLLDQAFSIIFPIFYTANYTMFMLANVAIIMLLFTSQFYKKWWLLFPCILIDIYMCVAYRTFPIMNIYTVTIVALLFFLRQMISIYNYKSIDISKLVPGMILSAASTALMLGAKIEDLPTSLAEDMSSRLTDRQVAAVTKWHNHHSSVKTITIVRKIPFIIFISIGYIVFVVLSFIK